MYVDALTYVAIKQAVTATAVSTNSIDLGIPPADATVSVLRQIGTGEPVGFAFRIDTAPFITTGDETYLFEVIEADSADLATNPVSIASVGPVTSAQITAGALQPGSDALVPAGPSGMFFVGIPQGQPTKRYLGTRVTTVGTTPAVTYSAFLTDREGFSVPTTQYPKAFNA